MSDAPVPSPCINVCVMDANGAYCIGCCRTLDEIARWSGLSDAGKREIVAKLDARRDPLSQARRSGPE